MLPSEKHAENDSNIPSSKLGTDNFATVLKSGTIKPSEKEDGIHLLSVDNTILQKKEKGLSNESCRKIGKKVVLETDEGTAMNRSVGLMSGVGIILGCIIGSGIFISPAGVQREAGSLGMSLVTWVLAGIFVIFGSYCYIELGLLLRESGGDYSYIFYAFGSLASFLRLWVEAVVVRPGTEAIVALTFGTYVVAPFYNIEINGSAPVLIVAALMILFQTSLNCLSIKGSLAVNNVCTVAKLSALVGVIFLGIYALLFIDDSTKSFENAFENTTTDPGAIARAFYSALFAYQGWNYLNFIVEEVRNPVKTLPRAIIISSFAVIVVYLLVNVAFYTALTPERLLKSPAAAIDFVQILTGWSGSGIIVSILVAVSCFGSGNGVIFTSSRLFFVGARNNHMPKFLLMTNRDTKTPIPAVILTGLLSMMFLALSDNAIKIINYIAISYWLAIGTAIGALFYYRLKIPREEYPFRVALPIAIIFFLGCVFLVLFPLFSNLVDALIGLGILATGIPVYFIFVRYRIKLLDNTADCLTKLVQVLFLVGDETVIS
jgi:amino acid transporter